MELSVNEYGTPVSAHVCHTCGDPFTLCPPCMRGDEYGCRAPACDSYVPEQDADVLFGDFSGFNRYCERTGKDPRVIGPEGVLKRTAAKKEISDE